MDTNLKEKASNVVDNTSTAAHTVAKDPKAASQNMYTQEK